MARRSDHTRDELKKLILDESWKIVAEEGFEALTARRIAKNIGYAPGTIYNLFSAMNALYLTINGQTLDLLYNALNHPVCNDLNKTPIENMKAMAEQYLKFVREYRPYWLMLFNPELADNRMENEWYQAKIERLFLPLERQLESYFPPAREKKKKMAARVLWASVHGLSFLQETRRLSIVSEKEKAPDMAGFLIDTFITGISEAKHA